MKRNIYTKLLKWKNENIYTPLMIIGARQVGKTYIIKEFCEKEFKKNIYINLLEHKEIVNLFKNVKKIKYIWPFKLIMLK